MMKYEIKNQTLNCSLQGGNTATLILLLGGNIDTKVHWLSINGII